MTMPNSDSPTADHENRPKEPLKIDFGMYLISLGTTVHIALGTIPNPATGQMQKDRELARQHIEILLLLKEKTKGNLTEEEEKLLSRLLYELQMAFVEYKK